MYPFRKDASFRTCFCFVHTIAQFSRILKFSNIYCQIFRGVPFGDGSAVTLKSECIISTIGSEKFQTFIILAQYFEIMTKRKRKLPVHRYSYMVKYLIKFVVIINRRWEKLIYLKIINLKFCPRFLLNQRWKSLSLCLAAPFLDVSVWSSTGNAVRRCRCRRVGFETNSSCGPLTIRMLAKRRWYVFGALPSESKNSAGPTRGKWNATTATGDVFSHRKETSQTENR
jgi:hypothetical protein